jgi:hypothetical protein
MSAKEIYENQRKLAQLKGGLQSLEYGLYEEAARNPALGMTDQERVNGHPDVIKGQREVATLTAEVDQAQEQIGGKVYRVPGENVYDLKKKSGRSSPRVASRKSASSSGITSRSRVPPRWFPVTASSRLSTTRFRKKRATR